MSLKVVKFDTKMYLNFSNFRGQTSAGGGQALVQKRGQVLDGGIGKIFAGWGDPPVPPGIKPWPGVAIFQKGDVYKRQVFNAKMQWLSLFTMTRRREI